MKTPKEYTDNLNNRILTTAMLSDALFSVNKRAKNYRNAKRKTYGKYRDGNEWRESKFYDKKEKILSVIEPVCIHKEHVGYERIRVKNNMPGWEDVFVCEALKGTIVWSNSYVEHNRYDYYDDYYDDYCPGNVVWFFDYVLPDKPEYKYYLYYVVGDHTFHTPISNPENYNLPIVTIGRIVTDGEDHRDLISVQFVDKLLALIEAGDYRLEVDKSECPESTDESVVFIPDFERPFYIGGKVIAKWFENKISPEKSPLRLEPSDARKKELKTSVEKRFANKHEFIQNKIQTAKKKKRAKWKAKQPEISEILPSKPSTKVKVNPQKLHDLLYPILPADIEECVAIAKEHFVTQEIIAAQIRALSEYDYVAKHANDWHAELLEKYGYTKQFVEAGKQETEIGKEKIR